MMNDSEIRSIIRQEIKQALTPVLMGFITSNEDVKRIMAKRMSNEGPMNVRSIQPFGLSSKAPPETQTLLVPIAGDPTNMNAVGNYDTNKPDVEDGEVSIYDNFGHEVYLSQDKMQFGSKDSANPMMLGDLVQECLSNMLQLIIEHNHMGNLGYPTGAPSNAIQFQQLKLNTVDSGDLVSDKCFTEK